MFIWDIYQPLMVLGRTLQKALEKFLKLQSYKILGVKCYYLMENFMTYWCEILENKIIGSKETHRLVFL